MRSMSELKALLSTEKQVALVGDEIQSADDIPTSGSCSVTLLELIQNQRCLSGSTMATMHGFSITAITPLSTLREPMPQSRSLSVRAAGDGAGL